MCGHNSYNPYTHQQLLKDEHTMSEMQAHTIALLQSQVSALTEALVRSEQLYNEEKAKVERIKTARVNDLEFEALIDGGLFPCPT